MKKFLAPLTISIFGFAICCIALTFLEFKSEKIIVEINAIIPREDSIQLFYGLSGATDSDKELCATTEVKGSNDIQKIRFSIPVEKSIKKFRIAMGCNRRQDKIKIESFVLKSLRNSLSYNVIDNFVPNKYVNIQDSEIHLRVIDNQYQPFLVSKFDVETVVEGLIGMQPVLPYGVVVILSFVISVSLFFVTYYTGFKLVSLQSSPYIFIFILIIFAPLAVKILNLDFDSTFTEKRELSLKPDFELSKEYPRKYEEYYNDNFGLRSLLVNWNSKIKMDFFKVSPKPELVLFGKNGYLFYNSKDDLIYDSYSNNNIVDDGTLEKIYENQLSIKQSLEEKGIKYIIGFFPNKHTVYREYLPFSMKMQVTGRTSLADQLVDYFGSREFPIIDLRNDLIAAGKEKQLYHKFDTHWNLYGAYYGYKSFLNQTFDVFGVTPHDTSFFDILYSRSRIGDLTNMMGISEMKSYDDEAPNFHIKDRKLGYGHMRPEGYPANTIITINQNVKDQKTVLIYCDSYAGVLMHMLSLDLYKVIYVRDTTVDMDLVAKAEPDVVISCCVERYLPIFFR